MPMTLETNVWQKVPGTDSAEIFPILTKPTITSSNCYIVGTPRAILVIDPGADANQTRLINEVVSAALFAAPRPVLVFLTHCHQDHSQEAGSLRLPAGTEVRRLAHSAAAAALERGDRELTVAYLYPWRPEICRDPIECRLFASDEHSVTLNVGSGPGFELHNEAMVMSEDAVLKRLSLALGDRERLEIYHTPGHTACSLSMRLGSILIVGDLPFAANPGLCGLDGWNQRDLLQTLFNVDAFFGRSDVTLCCPGHGHCIPADVMRERLRRMALEARDLSAVQMMSEGRIDGLKRHVDELLEETAALCTIISGRLYTTSYYLSMLGESQKAGRVADSLDLDQIDRILTEFRRFVGAFGASATPQLTVVLKGVQVARSLQQLLSNRHVEQILDRSLVGRAQRRLTDFLGIVRGLQFLTSEAPSAANDVIAQLLTRCASRRDVEAPDLLTALNDDESFLQMLTSRFAAHSPLQAIDLEFAPTSLRTSANVAADRLDDIVTGLIEGIAGAGMKHIRIATDVAMNDVVIRLSTRRSLTRGAIGQRRLELYNRTLGWLGGSLERREEDTGTTFVIRVPAIDPSPVPRQ